MPGGRVLSQDARGPREQRSGQQRSGEPHVHSETMGDDESDAGPPKTPRQPESGWDVGGGWDIGQRAAVPMPYYVFPENKDTVVLCRNQEDFASAVHQPRRCREERLKRHAHAMTRGQGSPAVGSPYAPLGDVADLEMPTRASTRESSRLKNLRVVYPRPLASKDNRERTPRPLRLGRIDAGYAYEREYCHYMVIVPANQSLEVEVHVEGATAPDVFACMFNRNPTSEAHTWRELGGREEQVILTIERTDPALHPGALFIGVYSLHETAFLVSARVREDPLEVPALNAVGSRVRGKYDGYMLIRERVRQSNEVTRRVQSGMTYATATDAVASPSPKPEARLAGSHSAPALPTPGATDKAGQGLVEWRSRPWIHTHTCCRSGEGQQPTAVIVRPHAPQQVPQCHLPEMGRMGTATHFVARRALRDVLGIRCRLPTCGTGFPNARSQARLRRSAASRGMYGNSRHRGRSTRREK